MKNLLFSRFDINGKNIMEGIYCVDGKEIQRSVKMGHEGLNTVCEDMVAGNYDFGIITYGNGEWDFFTQEAGVDGFNSLANYAFNYLEISNLFYSQNVFTFKRRDYHTKEHVAAKDMLFNKLLQQDVILEDDFNKFFELINEYDENEVRELAILYQVADISIGTRIELEEFFAMKAVDFGIEDEFVENAICMEESIIVAKYGDVFLYNYLDDVCECEADVIVNGKKYTVIFDIIPGISNYELTAEVEIVSIDGDEAQELLEDLKIACNSDYGLIYSIEDMAECDLEDLYSTVVDKLKDSLNSFYFPLLRKQTA